LRAAGIAVLASAYCPEGDGYERGYCALAIDARSRQGGVIRRILKEAHRAEGMRFRERVSSAGWLRRRLAAARPEASAQASR
jgi:hypothetical protein